MPGKQMAIDADLNAGAIDEDEARQRRRDVSDEADFYGAMDGASKFVKGDAIAGLVITAVNLIGGFLIGVVQRGLPIAEAISTYALLTVGDGLVSQIPALLVSIAAGLIVTRSTGNADLGSDVFAQFSRQGSAVRLGRPHDHADGRHPRSPPGAVPGRSAARWPCSASGSSSAARSSPSRRPTRGRAGRAALAPSRWPTTHASSLSSSTSAST